MKLIRATLAIVMALFLAGQVAIAGDSPKTVIETTVNNIISVLKARQDNTRLTTADRTAIRNTIEGQFDYEYMASRSLGKPWKKLNAEQKAHFTSVYRDLLEHTYGNRLAGYNDQKVEFENADLNSRGDKARVMSRVIDGQKEIPVEYSLHTTPSGWQVYDIKIEGASMVRTNYQDFQGVLDDRKGGGYEGLLKQLEEKVADLKSKDAS